MVPLLTASVVWRVSSGPEPESPSIQPRSGPRSAFERYGTEESVCGISNGDGSVGLMMPSRDSISPRVALESWGISLEVGVLVRLGNNASAPMVR